MKDQPGLEEVKQDIEWTRKEADAFRKLKEGYTTLTSLPELDLKSRMLFRQKSLHYTELEKHCLSFLKELEERKQKMEDGREGIF